MTDEESQAAQDAQQPGHTEDPFHLVSQALVRDAVADLTRPHIAICHSPTSGECTYLGPFSTGMAAVLAAEAEAEIARAEGFHLDVSVAVLIPSQP